MLKSIPIPIRVHKASGIAGASAIPKAGERSKDEPLGSRARGAWSFVAEWRAHGKKGEANWLRREESLAEDFP